MTATNIGPSDSIQKQSILDKRITAIHKGTNIMRLVINEKNADEQQNGPSNERYKGIHKWKCDRHIVAKNADHPTTK
jgi:hypothetical protein